MKLCFQLSKEEVSLSRMMMEAGEVAFAHKAHLENIISLRDQMDAWQQEERGEEECLEIFEEEANALVSCITVFQLLLREKKTILLHRYGIELSNEEWGRLKTIMDPSLSGEEYQEKISILQKKLTTRKKRERRNLYISDCHFYHRNMLTQMDMRPFESVEEMNERMVECWNAKVHEGDEVYILGDFSMAMGKETGELLSRLAGEKHLIIGNHDLFLKDRRFDRSLFSSIADYAEVKDKGRKLILSHYPIFCYKGQYRLDSENRPITHMLYGHVHNTHDELLVNRFIWMTRKTMVQTAIQTEPVPIPCAMINCFCMFSDYTPLTVEEWEILDEERRRKLWKSEGLLIDEEEIV